MGERPEVGEQFNSDVVDLISHNESTLQDLANRYYDMEMALFESRAELEQYRACLNDLLNDCINFDGGKLTGIYMENASKLLGDYRQPLPKEDSADG